MTDDRAHIVRYALRAVAGIAATTAFLALLVLGREPSVVRVPIAHPDALTRTREVLRHSVPDTMRVVTRKTVALTPEDLMTIAHYAFARKQLDGAASFWVRGNRLRMQLAVRVPWDWAKLYLNVRLIADDAQPMANIAQFKIGRLAIPHPLVGWLIGVLLDHGPLARYGRIARESIEEVRVNDGRLKVGFAWNPSSAARVGDWVNDIGMRARMLTYQQRLAEVVSRPEIKKYVRLSTLMQPLFALAKHRGMENQEPAEENRAVILVLNAYVNGREFAMDAGDQFGESPIPRRLPLLNRRVDTAQHFVISAALAVSGTRTLADVAAMAKEINDTHAGSGFSFTDLAADTAGAWFGRYSVHSEDAARNVQVKLADSSDESRFMPSIKDLPEHMKADEFEARYGSIESEAFAEVRRLIETRVAALPVYRF